jgi:hypothetical protein
MITIEASYLDLAWDLHHHAMGRVNPGPGGIDVLRVLTAKKIHCNISL